jgi:diguanylate cyclase (GGDEF)-like protein/PAS domain S-box-containing protein
MDAQVIPVPALNATDAPPWVERLYRGLVVYTVLCTAFMLLGVGGEQVTHYVGLFSDAPADLIATVVAFAAARRSRDRALCRAWSWLATAFGLYLIGTLISVRSWLYGQDPFPGPGDVFFLNFYGAMGVGSLLLIRAARIRVSWTQLCLDAAILVIGFGTFFWFLVVRPAGGHIQVDALKQGLSEVYAGLDCVVLLMLGVRLLTGADERRIPLLLITGFTTMFLADIFWSFAKMGGYYVSGDLQDVFYLASYVPWTAAGRAQMRMPAGADPAASNTPDPLARTLPYVTSLTVFLVLVYLARGDIGGPVAVMTTVVFTLTLLLMARQGVALRSDAVTRERRAARMVEDRFESLIANASDVIMIVDVDGVLSFVSPACERMLGFRPEEIVGKSLLEIWAGPDCERLQALLAEIAAAPGTVGPVEVILERGPNRRVLESVGSNLTAEPAVRGLALNFRDISERKALEQQLRQMAFHDPLTLLANRTLFNDRVQHALALVHGGHLPVAVLFLDLDNFKNINDSLGHDAGDRLLGAVAQRIAQNTRASDTVARLGGDEFAILVESVAAPSEARVIAESLIEALRAPFVLNGVEVRVAASVGVAYSSSAINTETLLSNADIAMYNAKAAGKNRCAVFEPRMQDVLHKRLRLEADIARALIEQEFQADDFQ